MKKIVAFLLLISVVSWSQNKQILYNFAAIPQATMYNPGADVSYKWYAGIPFLSGVSANFGSTGFSAYDLLADNGVDFNTKLRNVIFSTSAKDRMAINEQLEILSGGFKLKSSLGDETDSYLSFGLYQEFDFLTYVPKDPLILALEGNQNYIGKVFDLSDINMKAELLSVFHVGYQTKLKSNFIIGGRAKIYSSIYNASSTNNSGYIYTIPASDAVYEQQIYSQLQLNTSGLASYFDSNNDVDVQKDVTKRTLLGGNLGLGFDLGFTYYPKDNLQITGSIIDVGFIKHSKDVESYTLNGTYAYKGVVPNFNQQNDPGTVFQDFKDAIPLDTLNVKYTTWRPAKFNTSVQYSFEEERSDECNCTDGNGKPTYKSAFGAQFFMMTLPKTPMMALTAYYQRKILKGFHAKATYTLDSYSYSNLGLGIATQAGPVNFYILADNLLEYGDVTKANSLGFQFGLNVLVR